MTDLQSLLVRLEEATGPDRVLDFQIICAAEGNEYLGLVDPEHLVLGYHLRTASSPYKLCSSMVAGDEAPVTASLDAALRLVERCLPGWTVMNLCEWEDDRLRAKGPWLAQIKERGVVLGKPNPATCQNAATPALALLAALLRALIEQKAKEHD